MTTYQHKLVQLYTTSKMDGERHRKTDEQIEQRMNELGEQGYVLHTTTDYWLIMIKTIDEPTDEQIDKIAKMVQTPEVYQKMLNNEPLPFGDWDGAQDESYIDLNR